MFYSESLLTREGPLAQVWLAANLERKLSKAQFLQSNISQSTQAIVRATTQTDETEALALRLSGQLLYGVVRIYSRKAKYLLDDVSDALLKIKSAFKSSANSVTLPVNATMVSSINQLVLQDTITQGDLLYQEPLVFDDEPQQSKAGFFATQTIANDSTPGINLGFDNFDQPLETIDDLEESNIELLEPPMDSIKKKERKKRTVNKPLGKKIITDREIELEVSVFSNPSNITIATPSSQQITSASATLENKRAYIDSLLSESYINPKFTDRFFTIAAPPSKKAKIIEPELRSPEPMLPDLQSDKEDNDAPVTDFYDDGPADDFYPFDDQGQASHNADDSMGIIEERQDEDDEDNEEQDFPQRQNGVSENTGIVESHISSLIKEKQGSVTFTDVVTRDTTAEKPLAIKPKSEATRVFFELLVLATGDKVGLKQDELFGEISITSF
ncbi:Cohesin subunit rad21 [Cyberlindnera fabianii]|uniref:Cohesin subunit rad21 n=1 Tax=Cyberlindnera fabianii TaxID=36022 RepID=A0A1V2LE09_CYBFA|nr:Cohesin subunit rad21 [Cyberlindnera fabianii]